MAAGISNFARFSHSDFITVFLNNGDEATSIDSAVFVGDLGVDEAFPATFTSSDPCGVTALNDGLIPFACQSTDGRLVLQLFAAFMSSQEPPRDIGFVSLDNIVISGDGVSEDDLIWVQPIVPEPSSIMLAVIAIGASTIFYRRR